MPATNIQGLNIVHPAQESSSDSHDLLLGQAYPDLNSQLDLWNNLAFDSEEPLASRNDDHKKQHFVEEEEEPRSPTTGEETLPNNHVNVGDPSNNPINQAAHHPAPLPGHLFDISSLLAGFNADAFAARAAQFQQQQPSVITPSLAQLLALHQAQSTLYNTGLPQYATPPAPSSYSRTTAQATEEPSVPAKRARTRKASVTSQASPEGRESSMPPSTLSPSEDKRRRNTAASARFRLKKKERETALESKAKELETKVTELERECEGLRRENGWLKGLVIGVTGATQAPTPNQGLAVAAPPGPISAGMKRNREEAA